MKLTEINNKWYISVYELRKLGFDYPPKGTKGILRAIYMGDDNWYRFHEKKHDCDGIWISPFLTDIGKRNVSEGDFMVEFNTSLFEYKSA